MELVNASWIHVHPWYAVLRHVYTCSYIRQQCFNMEYSQTAWLHLAYYYSVCYSLLHYMYCTLLCDPKQGVLNLNHSLSDSSTGMLAEILEDSGQPDGPCGPWRATQNATFCILDHAKYQRQSSLRDDPWSFTDIAQPDAPIYRLSGGHGLNFSPL